MARQARLFSPGHAHLVQLQAVAGAQPLADARLRDRFLLWMREGLDNTALRLSAHAVLPQAVWLLLTAETAAELSTFVQGLARRTSRAQERAGPDGLAVPSAGRAPVWAGRFRSAVVQPGAWELTAMVWIDRVAEESQGNVGPVWPWSSRAAHCGETLAAPPSPALSLPSVYWELGNTPFEREAAYRQRLQQGVNTDSLYALERGLRSGSAVGDAAFLQQIEANCGRRVLPARRGRPRMKVA
jgi:putative transposase